MTHHLRRLAVVSTHTSPLARPGTTKAGGMNVYVAELARQLAARRRLVDIYTRRDRPDLPDVVQIAPGAQVVHVDVGPPTTLPPIEVAAHIDAFTARADQIARERGWSYELLHSHYWVSGLSGISLAQRWGCPHAATFHTLGEIKNRHYREPDIPHSEIGRPEPAIRIAGEHHVASCADLLIPWTDHERDFLVDFYRADPARIRIVPGGLDLERFSPGDRATARQALRRRLPALPVDDAPAILFLGRLERLKGVDILIEALARLESNPKPRLWIVGGDERDAAERARLRAIAEDLGVAERVAMHDAAPREALPDLHRAADICAMPSAYESFGLVAVEAMACGTPVVASAVGGLLTTVEHGRNGYLAAERSPAAFADALTRILNAPDGSAAMSNRAAASVRRYAWPAVAERMLGLYESLIAEPERDPSPCAEAAETLLASAGL